MMTTLSDSRRFALGVRVSESNRTMWLSATTASTTAASPIIKKV